MWYVFGIVIAYMSRCCDVRLWYTNLWIVVFRNTCVYSFTHFHSFLSILWRRRRVAFFSFLSFSPFSPFLSRYLLVSVVLNRVVSYNFVSARTPEEGWAKALVLFCSNFLRLMLCEVVIWIKIMLSPTILFKCIMKFCTEKRLFIMVLGAIFYYWSYNGML